MSTPAAIAHAGGDTDAGLRGQLALGVSILAFVNLVVVSLAEPLPAPGSTGVLRMGLATLVLVVTGAPIARRAWTAPRRGALAGDAFALGAALLSFAVGLLEIAFASRGAPSPPRLLGLLGFHQAAWQQAVPWGFEACAAVLIAAAVGRQCAAALRRHARRELFARDAARRGAEAPAALDFAGMARALDLVRAAGNGASRLQWSDVAARALTVATFGFAALALVAHGWLGRGLLSPYALFAACAVLATIAPHHASAAAAARTLAILRAATGGVVVNELAALEALAGVDLVLIDLSFAPDFDDVLARCAERAARGLWNRGIAIRIFTGDPRGRATPLAEHLGVPAARGLTPAERALALRDLQREGACVLVVGGGWSNGRADVTITVDSRDRRAPEAGPSADPESRSPTSARRAGDPGTGRHVDHGSAPSLVLTDARLDRLPALIDLARALRGRLRENAALATLHHALLLPPAVIGAIAPAQAAALAALTTLLAVGNAARMLRGERPAELAPEPAPSSPPPSG